MAKQFTDEEIELAIRNKLTVPLWPHTGRALGLSRNPTYAGAHSGEIPVVQIGGRMPVPTAWLRRKLGIDQGAA